MSKRKFGSSSPSLHAVQSGDTFVSPVPNKRSKTMGDQGRPRTSLAPAKPEQRFNYMIFTQAPEGVSIPLAMYDGASLPHTEESDESFSTESIESTSFESGPAGLSFYLPPSLDFSHLPPEQPIRSSSSATRPSRIGRKARPGTDEGTFPLPASQKGVNGRTLVMENLPSTWTIALVTRWGSRHGELHLVLIDHELRKAVLDYKRPEDSRRAYADKPIFLNDDVFLVYWRPLKTQNVPIKSVAHREKTEHFVTDVTRAYITPPSPSNLNSETVQDRASLEIEPPIPSLLEPQLSTISSVTVNAAVLMPTQEPIITPSESIAPSAPMVTPPPASKSPPTTTAEPAKTPTSISDLSPAALKAREIRLSKHIADTKLYMARYQAAITPAEKSSVLAILRECTRLYEEVEKAELTLASQQLPPPSQPILHTRPIRPFPRKRQNPFGIFAGRRFPEMEVCLGPIDVSDSEDEDLNEGDRP